MFKTEYISSKEKKQNRTLSFSWEYVYPAVLAFFISRASLVDKLTPFGIAFISAYLISGRPGLYVLISTIIGIYTVHGMAGMEYAVAAVAIAVLFNALKKIREYSLILSSLLSSFIFILTMSLYSIVFNDFLIYDLLALGFESLLVFTMTYIFSYSLNPKIERAKVSERIISIFITLSLLLAGLQGLSIYEMSIKNLISIMMILYAGHTKGAFIGSAIGITLGVVSYISQPEMPFILSIYGLAGLLSGVFREQGRIGSILGFVLGNGIISFYINGYGISFISLRELIVSTSLFMLLYKPINKALSEYIEAITFEKKEKSYSHRKDEVTVNKLNELSEVFNEIGQTFRKSAEESKGYNVKEVYEMIDNAANNVCVKCAMRKFCWQQRFYSTYNSMFKITALLEEKIPLTNEVLPKAIRDYCINKGDVIRELKNQFDRLRVNSMWKGKIIQNRLLVSEQLEGVSKIIKNMVKEIYVNPTFKEDVEEMLFEELKKSKVDVTDVVVMELEKDNIEVYVEVDKAYKEVNNQENIKRIVSESIGIPLKSEYNINQKKKEKQRFKLIRCNRYSALTEAVTKPNNQSSISGDSHTFGEGENIYFAAISDGMGAGKKAFKESNIAISLMEKFLEAKFDKELALKTINSVLMLKSNDEIFTTLDLALIDLYTGKLQLVKSGAPATFIKKRDRVEVINSQSLPVGILKDVDFNIYEEYLEDGDIIIMMSDGVLESNQKVENPERWMKNVIIGIDSLNPRAIGEEIIRIATEANDGSVLDDMTVLVTKIWKTA